jgi:two-component system, LytTR family, sensor kinase
MFRVVVHLIAWLVYVTLLNLLYFFDYGSKLNVGEVVVDYLVLAIVFYFHSEFVFKVIVEKKRYILGALFSLSGFLAYYILSVLTTSVIVPFLYGTKPIDIDYVYRLIYSTYYYLTFMFFSFGYYFAKLSIKKERQLRIAANENFKIKAQQQQQNEQNLKLKQEKLLLQQTNLQLEKKQIELENAYLRAQINPHFLHNTLNFFFSKSLKAGAHDLGEAIMGLSKVMRFSLEAKPDENGRVPVAQELEHLQNMIKMNEIRFTKTYYLRYQVEGDADNAKIIPLILITMVENAFKYGEWFDPDNPVKIQITIHDQHFRFYLHNKKRFGGAKEPSHGIGVSNSVKRLQAAYGQDGYSINIQEDAVYYSVSFTIPDLSRIEQPAFNPIPEPVPVTA